jgi:hypothetical protein
MDDIVHTLGVDQSEDRQMTTLTTRQLNARFRSHGIRIQSNRAMALPHYSAHKDGKTIEGAPTLEILEFELEMLLGLREKLTGLDLVLARASVVR